jgi:glycerol-3-phosphate dehydrogenase
VTLGPADDRRKALAALADEEHDLLVVGGGATGCGIARDAALRGLKVALIDAHDLAFGTSSRSSKLIHGGLRYLQQGDIRLVFEGTNERALLMKLAPHVVRPLEFLAPLYEGDKPGLFLVDIGLWIYDAMAKFSGPRIHKTYRSGAKLLKIEPSLRAQGLKGGIVYYDAVTDDARLTIETALDARSLGARIVTYAAATRLLKRGDRVVGLGIRDQRTGDEIEARARAVVCALGPFTDDALAALGAAAPRPVLRPTKGVHFVFPDDRIKVQHAIVVRAPRDGRVVFFIPWPDVHRTIVGTTDTDYQGDVAHPAADAADAEYLLACTEHFAPAARLSPADAISSWAGLRPLINPDHDISRSYDVSREHSVFEQAPGLFAIAGGKLTTYRRMARDAVDRVLPALGTDPASRPCRTHLRALPGAQLGIGEPESGFDEVGVALEATRGELEKTLPPDIATHLVHTYGLRAPGVLAGASGDPQATARVTPDLPYVWAEVEHAVRGELAVTVADVLRRRVPLLLNDREQGLAAVEAVAQRMGRTLGWDEATRTREIAAYRAEVDESRRFR